MFFFLEQSSNHKREIDAFDTWILISQVFMELSQFKDSLFCLETAAKLDPFHPDSFFWRGKLAELENDKNIAIRNYKDALGCDAE